MFEIRGKIVGISKKIFNVLIDVCPSGLPHNWNIEMVGIIMMSDQIASAKLKLLKLKLVMGCLIWFRHSYVSCSLRFVRNWMTDEVT